MAQDAAGDAAWDLVPVSCSWHENYAEPVICPASETTGGKVT